MSEKLSTDREWNCYLKDMIKRCEKVLAYTDELDKEALLANEITYEATLLNIQLIGEAANNIPLDVQEAHPEIPWHAIIGTRNRLAHAYLNINNSVIWSIIEEALPSLLPQLQNLLSTYGADHNGDSYE